MRTRAGRTGRGADPGRVHGRRLLVKGPKQRGLGLFGKPGSIDVTIGCRRARSCRATRGRRRSTARAASAMPGQERGRRHPARSRRRARPEHRAGASRGPRDGHRRGKHRRPGAPGPDRRQRSDQELQRRLLGRRDHRRPAGEHGQRRHLRRPDAGAGVAASTANGDVRVGEVTRGSASLKTSFGEIEIGIRAGTAARLDVSTKFGRVLNDLAADGRPRASERDRRGARVHQLRRHPDPPFLTSRTCEGSHDDNHDHDPAGDLGDRAAQVVRRQGGARRHRPHRRRRDASSRCSAPTAPARPRWCTSCPP